MNTKTSFALAITATAMLGLAGCAADQPPMQKPLESASTEASPSEEPTVEPDAAMGTRENPIPVNTLTQYDPASVWSFAVSDTNTDAWASVIQGHNELNSPPAEGETFIIVPVHIEVADDMPAEGGEPVQSLEFEYVTADGVTHEKDFFGSACGLYPDSFNDLGTLYAGASVDVNVCAAVPTEDVAGGNWRVSSFAQPSSFIFLEGAR